MSNLKNKTENNYINHSSTLNLITMEKWWTKKSSPDDIRSTFNADLLKRVVETKLNSNK
jgi:hypothetical protein